MIGTKKKILITACSMEVGGIERSLAGLVGALDSEKYDVDVLLFSKKGEFLPMLDGKCTLLPEIPQLASLLKPVREVALSGHPLMAASRVYSKYMTDRKYKFTEVQQDAVVFAYLQAYWDNSIALMPRLGEEYDAALSFMWPHHFVAKKVRAKKKIAWIHTDYTKATLDNEKDREIWDSFDSIAAVSAECGRAFTKVYPSLSEKVVTVENILSAELVRSQAEEFTPTEMESADDGFTRLLTAGRFCYAKAFDVAVEVCKILVQRGIKIKWYAVGYGSEQQKVEEKIRREGLEESFMILGKKVNPYPYMKSCDIYVQPSRYEGKAVTVREAQILGRPVIITDFTTARSQVRDGFDALIAPMKPEDVADCIEGLIGDGELRERLAKNALEADYGCEKQIGRIYELID